MHNLHSCASMDLTSLQKMPALTLLCPASLGSRNYLDSGNPIRSKPTPIDRPAAIHCSNRSQLLQSDWWYDTETWSTTLDMHSMSKTLRRDQPRYVLVDMLANLRSRTADRSSPKTVFQLSVEPPTPRFAHAAKT